MKRFSITLITMLLAGLLSAQNVGINTDGAAPDASAMLDVKSNAKGFLAPRMTKAQRDGINLPANGLLIYQTDNTPGFYYYNGSVWTAVTTAASSETDPIFTAWNKSTGISITKSQVSDFGTYLTSYAGTTAPTGTTRANYNGYLYATRFYGDGSQLTNVAATSATTATTATTATNLAAGSLGTIPYQSAAGTTAQLAAGTSGYLLKSNGAAAPSWLATVPVANGGTGATTLTGYVKGTGTTAMTASATIPAADISGNITGNAANVTGTVAVANGGTGTTTGSITGTGALTFAAGGSNQNVNITPSGVGYTMLGGNVGIGGTAHSGYKLYITDATTTSGQMSLYINKSNSTASANGYGIQSNVNLSGASSNSVAIMGNATGTGGNNYGILGQSTAAAATNYGVHGYSTSGTTVNYGVYGGVSGASGTNYGGYFTNTSTTTTHKYGSWNEATGASSGDNVGILGKARNSTGKNYGVYGTASGSAGTYSYGGYFENVTTTNNYKYGSYSTVSGASATYNYAVYGLASGSTLQNIGVYGLANVATTGTNTGAIFSASGGGANYALITSGGNVGLGTTTPAYQLDVAGDVNLTGVLRINGAAGTAGQYLKSNGASDPTWSDVTATTATTATNIAGGSAGTIPYQSAAGTTAQLAAGTSGYILKSNGAAAPSWLSTVPVANGGTGTSTGSITGTGALAFTAGGANANVTLTPTGTGDLVLNGYTRLGGATAPAIKYAKFTGTTSATQGGYISVVHGMDVTKFVSVTGVMVVSGNRFPLNMGNNNHVALDDYETALYTSSNNINIYSLGIASVNVPFTVIIMYEE